MPSGFQSHGTDLDSVFAPFHSGWPQAGATGYGSSGDLNARYAPLSTGSAASATGYDKFGADLNTIFAALGSTSVQVGTQPSNVSGTAAAGRPSGTVTSGTASCAGSKGGGTYTYAWTTSGCTATSPSSQSTTFSATVGAGTTDSASAFCTISDGVTSINTRTISVTLQNTTLAGDALSLLVGTASNDVGFANGAFGILTPFTLGDGAIVQILAVANHLAPTPFQLVFEISNYPGTITQAYLTSLNINGSVIVPGDANYTGFGGGTPGGSAQWIWQNEGVPIVGHTIPILVVRT